MREPTQVQCAVAQLYLLRARDAGIFHRQAPRRFDRPHHAMVPSEPLLTKRAAQLVERHGISNFQEELQQSRRRAPSAPPLTSTHASPPRIGAPHSPRSPAGQWQSVLRETHPLASANKEHWARLRRAWAGESMAKPVTPVPIRPSQLTTPTPRPEYLMPSYIAPPPEEPGVRSLAKSVLVDKLWRDSLRQDGPVFYSFE